ncbi:MAG TPA: hypothetical protein PLN33_11230 [Hyphomonadaceae bacterium]|nr:hypothetical protein [Hyphomonadaceae bacterium]
MSEPLTHCGYNPGHPWYYHLGGKPLFPKQILREAKLRSYRGYYSDEIAIADGRCEPRRSEELRKLRNLHLGRLRTDLAGYRDAIRAVRDRPDDTESSPWMDECVSAGLKYSHVYNELAHLAWLDELLTRQRDLFE